MLENQILSNHDWIRSWITNRQTKHCIINNSKLLILIKIVFLLHYNYCLKWRQTTGKLRMHLDVLVLTSFKAKVARSLNLIWSPRYVFNTLGSSKKLPQTCFKVHLFGIWNTQLLKSRGTRAPTSKRFLHRCIFEWLSTP